MSPVAATDGRYGKVTPCRRCGSPVRWTVTTNRKRLPVDAAPSLNGNITLAPVFRGQPAVATVHRDNATALAESAGEPVWMPHFATCSPG